jgi:hypothetical protein
MTIIVMLTHNLSPQVKGFYAHSSIISRDSQQNDMVVGTAIGRLYVVELNSCCAHILVGRSRWRVVEG